MKNSILILLLLSSIVVVTYAQEDMENSEDHALVSRYPGSYISSYETIKYREYSLAYGPITGYRYIEDKLSIAGQLYRITYELDKEVADLSIGEVYKDYKQALEKEGISILADGLFSNQNVKKEVGGGSWIGTALKPNGFAQKSNANYLFAGTSSAGGTFAIMGRLNRPDGLTYIAIYGERHSNKKVIVHVDIIEEKAAETGHISVDADYMKKEMEEKGMVLIYGILFDFDSAKIKPESKPTLEEIAKFLKANPTLNIYVVGHTDMKGTLPYNNKLSKDRAQAVVEELLKNYAIESSRLEAQGLGPLSPVSNNTTEEGRTLNRRVELIQKI